MGRRLEFVDSRVFVNIDQIKDQCYSLVNLTPSDVFCILHIELKLQVKVALTSETSSAHKELKVFMIVRR
jgi:hypothetical protein